MTIVLTKQDIADIAARGMTPDHLHAHLRRFRRGFSPAALQRPCTPGDGIFSPTPEECDRFAGIHDEAVAAGRVMRFVPASGLGSRMFQRLLALARRPGDCTRARLKIEAQEGDAEARRCLDFFRNLKRFPFYEALCAALGATRLERALQEGWYAPVLETLLTERGLDYPNLPKGLLPFHRYADHTRTPFEEHLVEAIACIRDRQGVARVHFTVSPEHLEAARRHVASVRSRYETPGVRLDITWSVQKTGTDVLAMDGDDRPFRDEEGRLVFRAGGHGALLDNLDALQGDIVFIKNIDNVVPDHLKRPALRHHKVLGGCLVDLQRWVFAYMEQLTSGDADHPTCDAIMEFAGHTLGLSPPKAYARRSPDEKIAYLLSALNRPMRVCGMVKNTGEPGGGPFWVKHPDGGVPLQIIEAAQVDGTSDEQREIFQASTHFNPVNMACGVRDYRGRPFNLPSFRDPDAGFISSKSKNGTPLRAMELPGLWNGSMAYWNTVFVEAPASTFNPVKTVEDLIRPAHQPAYPLDDPSL